MSTLQVGSYSHIIKPENIESVNTMVDAALADLVTIEQEVQQAYGNRAELVKAVKQLEGDIKLKEAGAFMQIGVDNTVEIDGNKVKLANAEMRDMYRRYVSREPRQQLSNLERLSASGLSDRAYERSLGHLETVNEPGRGTCLGTGEPA